MWSAILLLNWYTLNIPRLLLALELLLLHSISRLRPTAFSLLVTTAAWPLLLLLLLTQLLAFCCLAGGSLCLLLI